MIRHIIKFKGNNLLLHVQSIRYIYLNKEKKSIGVIINDITYALGDNSEIEYIQDIPLTGLNQDSDILRINKYITNLIHKHLYFNYGIIQFV